MTNPVLRAVILSKPFDLLASVFTPAFAIQRQQEAWELGRILGHIDPEQAVTVRWCLRTAASALRRLVSASQKWPPCPSSTNPSRGE